MSGTYGLARWSPTEATFMIVSQVVEILDDYADYLPMTGRQIFYRMVATNDYPKREKDYKNLLSKLARARRAGMISWDSIRDDGVTVSGDGGYSSELDFMNATRYDCEVFQLDRSLGQPVAVEMWVEAAGMVPQAQQALSGLGITVYSTGGYNSVTMKHQSARRFIRRSVPTVVLHVGDHDPSGVGIYDNLCLDLRQFLIDYGRPAGILVMHRLGITPDQAEALGAPSAPAKDSDSRSVNWEGPTWQAEALPPDEMARLMREAVVEVLDMDQMAEVLDDEARIRERLIAWIDDFGGSV